MIIFDLHLEQGSTFTQTLELGADLTGCTITGNMKDSVGVITEAIVDITDAVAGTIVVGLTNVETALLSVGVGYYDIELTIIATSSVEKPLKGRVYVSGEVTK